MPEIFKSGNGQSVFSQPVIAVIRRRSSWRSYSGEPLSAAYRAKLRVLLDELGTGPFGNRIRFSLVSRPEKKPDRPVRLGTYGFISRATDFIVGAVRPAPDVYEDFGYLLEKIILHLTDWDLGTCWLGGSFAKGDFAKAINLQPDEIIPAVTPVGLIAHRRTLRDRVIRTAAGSRNRKSWTEIFFDQTFARPLTPQTAGQFAEALEMVRLAPSASNRQPWRILKINNHFHFFLKRSKGYNAAFQADLQKVDLGIAMCHFELTVRASNLPGQWTKPDPELPLPGDWRVTEDYPAFPGVEYICSWMPRSLR